MLNRKEILKSDPNVIELPDVFVKGVMYLVAKCNICKLPKKVTINSYWRKKKEGLAWSCQECLRPIIAKKAKSNPKYSDPEYCRQFADLHKDKDYSSRVHNELVSQRISESVSNAWKDEDIRRGYVNYRNTKSYKKRVSKWSKELWKDQEFRRKYYEHCNSDEYKRRASESAKLLWSKPEYRKKIAGKSRLSTDRPTARATINPEAKVFNFSLNDVIIRTCEPNDEFKMLLSKYHYLANIGRIGSERFGAFYNNTLIAAAVFSSLTRNESAIRFNLKPSQMLELTRFCIHPSYQKKNFASWFLSKACHKLFQTRANVQRLITFADTTYGHNGTIYKASNWIFDGEVKPDYWYTDELGCYYHKKTIWDHASKMGISEVEYANIHKLRKITGNIKLRFLFNK